MDAMVALEQIEVSAIGSNADDVVNPVMACARRAAAADLAGSAPLYLHSLLDASIEPLSLVHVGWLAEY